VRIALNLKGIQAEMAPLHLLKDSGEQFSAAYDILNPSHCQDLAAHYMFGYYAHCAHEGKHLRVGIAMTAEHWALFFRFVENSKRFDRSPGRQ
jgi:hypothetical protein